MKSSSNPSTRGVGTSRMSPAQAEAMVKRDRNRLIMMFVAAVMLGAAYFGTRLVGNRAQQEEDLLKPELAQDAENDSPVVTLAFNDPEALDAIADASAEQRLALSNEALSSLLLYSLTLGVRNYEALGIRDLDTAVSAELAADPGAHRVDPLRARGWLEHLSKRKRKGASTEEHYGTLRLEDDSRVHIAFITPPEESLATGDFVRLDGVFVQLYRAEVGGEWHDAPLIVGRNVVLSYPRCAAPDREELLSFLLRNVEDDDVADVSGVPHEPLWQLMAYARERADEIDWSNDESVLEMTSDNLNLISKGGDFFRGKPFRLPISGNLGAWTESAGENCQRLERVTLGWIGNFTWKGGAPVIKFIAPHDWPDLKDRYGPARLVTGKGFYLKNIIYKKFNGEPGRAPLFVMSEITAFTPPVNNTTQYIMWGVLGTTLLMIGLVWFLLRRDARKSQQLQSDLIRRRRAREERATRNKTLKSVKTT